MGNLGHHPFASATNEVWLARILIRGLVILPIFVVAFVTGSPALGLHELGLLDNVPMLAVQGTGFCGVALLWPLGLLTGALLEALCGNPYPLAADLPRESAPTPQTQYDYDRRIPGRCAVYDLVDYGVYHYYKAGRRSMMIW